MSAFWPTDDGWPYPDSGPDVIDHGGDIDDDLLTLRSPPPHLFDGLDPLEREVITSRFGLGGVPVRTMKQLHNELGVPRADLKIALGSGLAKLRHTLA